MKNELGKVIKDARLSHGLSQRDLSKICGITQTQICRIETSTKKPYFTTLKILSQTLDLDILKLCQLAGYDFNKMNTEYPEIYTKHEQQLFYTILSNHHHFSQTDVNLIITLCEKISTLSEKEKAIISLILNDKSMD